MNKIEKLINELCPDGVEWRELWEETVWDKKFNSVEKHKQLEVDKYRYLLASETTKIIQEAGEIKILTTNKSDIFTSYEYVDEFYDEEIVAIPWGGNPIVQYYKGKFVTADNRIARVKDKNRLNTKFLFYYLTNNINLISTFYRGSGIKHPNMLKVLSLKLPIPPIEIQEEIVKILDKFTDYVTELTLRQKQYNYYRDKLLSFEETLFEVKKKRIGDILIKGKGTKITASQMKSLHKEGNPIRIFAGGKTFADIDYGDIPEKDVHEETAIIVKSRGIIDFEYYSEPFSFKNEFWSYSSIDENINLRYIYHYLKYNKNHFQVIANNMQMPQISSSDTENYLIPIPKLEIQSRIVQVLDNFDTVCNDLNIGLPKEIELRQKQYEFFRDKLLTFAAEGVYTDSTVQYRQDIIRLLQWVFGPIKVKLGSICDLERGKRVVKSQLSFTDGYPVFQNSLTPLGYFERYNRQSKNTFIVCAGAAGEVGFSKIPFWAADDIFTVDNSQNIVSKYIYYVLLHQQNRLKSKVRMASIPRLSRLSIENIQFVLPKIDTQIDIVNKLDKFNAICSDLSVGLPKEIELRQKQYEYYRDKLLTFD